MAAHGDSASALQRFALDALPASQWRNGAGLTREIVRGSVGAAPSDAASWDWRISVADIVQAGPFSVFPGTDRVAALASGSGLQLLSADGVLRFDALGSVHAFAGETPLVAALSAGAVQLFNVMVRRACVRAGLCVFHGDVSLDAAELEALVVLCVRGEFRSVLHGIDGAVGLAGPLRQGDGFTSGAGRHAAVHLQALAPDSCLILARVERA